MPQTVAVTGASGHIGNVVCRTLLEKGYHVRALYHNDITALSGLHLELIKGDVLHPANLQLLMQGCDILVHCAAIISIDGDNNGKVFETNTLGPKNALAAAITCGVKKVIHLSSVHAVNDLPHQTPYDESRVYKTAGDFIYDYSKATGEQIMLNGAKKTNIEIIVVRPSCVVGPFDFKPSKMGHALMQWYRHKIPFIPKGGYDIVDVRDVAGSICSAITNGEHGNIYLLSGKYYSFKDLIRIIALVTQQKKTSVLIPYWLLHLAVPFARWQSLITGSDPSVTRESIVAVRDGHPHMDHTKASAILQHHPRPLEETIRDHYRWMQDHFSNKRP